MKQTTQISTAQQSGEPVAAVISRKTAAELSPFVGFVSAADTMCNVRTGLEFLDYAVEGFVSSGGNERAAYGASLVLRSISKALSYELEEGVL